MNLPVGIYAVSVDFKDKNGQVTFTFRDETYFAQVGVNAFADMDQLVKQPLVAAEEEFLGYAGRPIVLVPAGVLTMGNGPTREEKFRTCFPCAAVILGENAHINPNGPDLRTPARRRPESVLLGSFYFGCVAIRDETPGTLTVDGICLQAKIQDLRTGGEDAVLEIKNTVIESAIVYTLIQVSRDFRGNRRTVIRDCRADGVHSRDGEGNLFRVDSGDVLVEGLYVANTRKFLGMSDYSRDGINDISSLTLRRCLFENSTSTHGLTVNLPQDSTAQICVEDCTFSHFTPGEDPAITVILPKGSTLAVKDTCFVGDHAAPAILVEGDVAQVTLEGVTQTGYTGLCVPKPPRRTSIDTARAYPVTDPHTQLQTPDFTVLDKLYEGRQIFYGDFHCHSDSGGSSDGRTPIENYVADMQALGMDFAAIVDHRQMRHFFLPCWDEQYLICGTEPGMDFTGTDRHPYARRLDYTMIFPDKTGLAQVVGAFPGFQFSGTVNGVMQRYNMSPETFRELAAYVYRIGGLLSHAHPKQLLSSDDPMDYYISECVPLETVHVAPDNFATKQNRDLWVALLDLGKRVRTHGSSDAHGPVSNRGLTAVYAEKHYSTDIFNVIRSGDCTAGGVAIQMSVDDTPMGSVAAYDGDKTLYVRVAGFHPAHQKPDTVFCMKVYTDKGLAYAREFDCMQAQTLALSVQKRKYYRVEITNESDGCLVALSNPVWLEVGDES